MLGVQIQVLNISCWCCKLSSLGLLHSSDLSCALCEPSGSQALKELWCGGERVVGTKRAVSNLRVSSSWVSFMTSSVMTQAEGWSAYCHHVSSQQGEAARAEHRKGTPGICLTTKATAAVWSGRGGGGGVMRRKVSKEGPPKTLLQGCRGTSLAITWGLTSSVTYTLLTRPSYPPTALC